MENNVEKRIKIFKVVKPHINDNKEFICRNCYLFFGRGNKGSRDYSINGKWRLFCHDGDKDNRCSYTVGHRCRSGLGWENCLKLLTDEEANVLRVKFLILGKEFYNGEKRAIHR